MSLPTIALYNPVGGGDTHDFTFHLAWMLRDLEARVVVIDLDPRALLTSAFIRDEQRLETLWSDDDRVSSIAQSLSDPALPAPEPQPIDDGLELVPGDPDLAAIAATIAAGWERAGQSVDADELGRDLATLIETIVTRTRADVALLHLGAGVGEYERACLLASQHLVVPIDVNMPGSLRGLEVLGDLWRTWRDSAASRTPRCAFAAPAGYVVTKLVRTIERERWSTALARWNGLAEAFERAFTGPSEESPGTPATDPRHMGTLLDHRALRSLAEEAGKPVFALKPADGALGNDMQLVLDVHREYRSIAEAIASACEIPLGGTL